MFYIEKNKLYFKLTSAAWNKPLKNLNISFSVGGFGDNLGCLYIYIYNIILIYYYYHYFFFYNYI